MNAVDTNVLVYAFDLDEPVKRRAALGFMESLPVEETVLLWQVALEFSSVITRSGTRERKVADRRAAIESLCQRFPLVMPGPDVLASAWNLREKHQLSWWDAALIAACLDAGVSRLYSEDLQSKPVIEGVAIVNPFLSA